MFKNHLQFIRFYVIMLLQEKIIQNEQNVSKFIFSSRYHLIYRL